jgi:UDP-3-O-[3-hydroxymyristoyl] N-acetylglucosamine deacetylase
VRRFIQLKKRKIVNETVLVVDDEERIRSSLRGILGDEGFRVLDTGDPAGVMELIAREHPALVLLDIWMPNIDGIELLRRIKAERPEVRVIMISGHGNIQNAVAATRLGAADFIEKPFSVSGLLTSIERVLERESGGVRMPGGASPEAGSIDATAPRPAPAMGISGRKQRTLARSVVAAGQGLHSGLKTGVILHPAPAGFGILFSSVADETAIAARLENVTDTGYNTTLTASGRSVRTVEHLMSALHGMGISNLLIKTDDEVPALDGSAIEFCRQISDVGVEEQEAAVEPVRIERTIAVRNNGESIRVEPAAHLIIDYTLEYPRPIGSQSVHFELTSPAAYMREIAPARTFGFVHEFHKLAEMGLASGGRLDNLILIDDEKVVNTTLRFADEFARHKVLDLIGDLYLLGRPILGHVIAHKTGHSDNLALLRAVKASL